MAQVLYNYYNAGSEKTYRQNFVEEGIIIIDQLLVQSTYVNKKYFTHAVKNSQERFWHTWKFINMQ